MSSARTRKRARRLRAALPAAVVLFAVAGALGFVMAHASDKAQPVTHLSVVAIEPGAQSAGILPSDIAGELKAASGQGGELVVTAFTNTGTEPAYSGTFTCASGTDSLSCADQRNKSEAAASARAQQVLTQPAPSALNDLSVMPFVAGQLSTRPSVKTVSLYLNTTSNQNTPPVDLRLDDLGAHLASDLQAADAAGVVPKDCRGWSVHLIVPASGNSAHDAALQAFYSQLFASCGGRVQSWSQHWLSDTAGNLVLPRIADANVTVFGTPAKPTFTLSAALFDTNSDTPNGAGTAAVSTIAQTIIASYPGQPITVVGSADSTGSPVYNQALSQRRADDVRALLIQAGVGPSLITARGIGALPDNGSTQSRAQNRRVDIVVGAA